MHWVIADPTGLDALASAWLIRRFVDDRACFGFPASDGEPGVPVARFGELAARHRPDDPALRTLVALVAGATGPGDRDHWAECAGLRLLGRGLPLVAAGEDAVVRSSILYDALYAAVRRWPPCETRAAREARSLAWFWLR